jgi:hypothetical protein
MMESEMTMLMGLVEDLARHVEQDSPSKRVRRIEGQILDATPSEPRDAGAIAAIASTWMLADADPEMLERAHGAMKRLAVFLGGVPAAAAEYYGLEIKNRSA